MAIRSKVPKNPYKGGSSPLKTNCGVGTCPANVRLIKQLYYFRNKEACLLRAKNQPKEKTREYKKRWKENNPGLRNADNYRRKKHVKAATPPWLTAEHHAAMNEIYKEAARLTKETGIPHHVDHIVPLRGKNVSGLHAPWNLQILTADENYKKNNKFGPEQDLL